MRTIFTNALFAGVSLALTAGVVTVSAAPAAAAVPTGTAPQAVVRFSDLNLADKGGRADLEARIRVAAAEVCPTDGGVDFAAMQCRNKAIAQAHRDVADQTASRSAAPVSNVAP